MLESFCAQPRGLLTLGTAASGAGLAPILPRKLGSELGSAGRLGSSSTSESDDGTELELSACGTSLGLCRVKTIGTSFNINKESNSYSGAAEVRPF